jgi:hypothetical protein
MTCQGASDLGTQAALDFRILVFFSFATKTHGSVSSVSSPDNDDDDDDDDDDATMGAIVIADDAAMQTVLYTVQFIAI